MLGETQGRVYSRGGIRGGGISPLSATHYPCSVNAPSEEPERESDYQPRIMALFPFTRHTVGQIKQKYEI